MDIPFRKTADGILIEVRLQPRASRSRIVGPHGGALKVQVTAPPVEGEANRALIELLAVSFKVKKKDIEIVKGASSRSKTVLLRGLDRV
jgi:uncharacterized protein (TIGR00251 family)